MDSKVKVLIVDDERTTRFMYREGLEREGYIIDEAVDAENALAKIHSFMPDVVLLDIMMPGITGDKIVETIKTWKPDIHVIMVTSVQTEGTHLECFIDGAFEVVVKPVAIHTLKETIERALK